MGRAPTLRARRASTNALCLALRHAEGFAHSKLGEKTDETAALFARSIVIAQQTLDLVAGDVYRQGEARLRLHRDESSPFGPAAVQQTITGERRWDSHRGLFGIERESFRH